MAYVKGTENEFKGFGAVEDSFQAAFEANCLVTPTAQACIDYYNKKYAGTRAASKAFIEQHEKDPRYGHVLAQALDGASNPEAIGERAQILADQFSSDAFKKSAYQFLYSQARTGLEIADQYLSMYPQAAAIGAAIQSGEHLFYEGRSIFQKYEDTGLDAAGVGDVMNLMKKSVVTTRGLARSLGVPAGSTADEVLDWAGIAAGCGAAIATGMAGGSPGTVGGAVTCAVSALTKVFSLFGKMPVELPKINLKDTIFAKFEPHSSQRGLIAADAARLAALLRYRYGIQRWPDLMAKAPLFGDGWEQLRKLRTKTSGIAVGFTPLQTLQIMGGRTTGIPLHMCQRCWAGGMPVAEFVEVARSGQMRGQQIAFPSQKIENGFKDWAELVTFFATVTARELSVDPLYVEPWKAGLPVRFWYMDTTGNMPKPEWETGQTGGLVVGIYPGQHLYSDEYVSPGKSIESLVREVSYVKIPSMYEFGALRLAAAFSYLKMSSDWGEWRGSSMASLQGGKDVLADLDSLDHKIAASGLRLPVDPRRSSWGGRVPSIQQLLGKITDKAVMMNTIAAKARADARADFRVVQLAGEAKRQMLLAEKGAPVASMYKNLPVGVQMLQAGMVEVSEKLKCTQAGYTWDPAKNVCDYSKPYVPEVKPTGVGGLAVVGAAALLGLFLLRR